MPSERGNARARLLNSSGRSNAKIWIALYTAPMRIASVESVMKFPGPFMSEIQDGRIAI